jgi:hypothetical protein
MAYPEQYYPAPGIKSATCVQQARYPGWRKLVVSGHVIFATGEPSLFADMESAAAEISATLVRYGMDKPFMAPPASLTSPAADAALTDPVLSPETLQPAPPLPA